MSETPVKRLAFCLLYRLLRQYVLCEGDFLKLQDCACAALRWILFPLGSLSIGCRIRRLVRSRLSICIRIPDDGSYVSYLKTKTRKQSRDFRLSNGVEKLIDQLRHIKIHTWLRGLGENISFVLFAQASDPSIVEPPLRPPLCNGQFLGRQSIHWLLFKPLSSVPRSPLWRDSTLILTYRKWTIKALFHSVFCIGSAENSCDCTYR